MTQQFRRTAASSPCEQAPGRAGSTQTAQPQAAGSSPRAAGPWCSTSRKGRGRKWFIPVQYNVRDMIKKIPASSQDEYSTGQAALGSSLDIRSISQPVLHRNTPPPASCALKAASGAKEGQWIARPLNTWLIYSVHPLIYVYKALLASAWKSLASQPEISPAVLLQLLACFTVPWICLAISLPVPSPQPLSHPSSWLINHLFLWQLDCS